MEFVFKKKTKNVFFGMMAIGLIAILVGAFSDHHDHGNAFWGNLLINSFFFLAIGLGALFFNALQYATETGWSVLVKRIFEGLYATIPVFGGLVALVLLAGSFGWHHLYHWMDPHVYEPLLESGAENPHYDSIIAGKKAFLNQPFFWFRTLVYLGTFIFFARKFRAKSLLEDQVGGTDIHFWLYRRSALFLVFFAVFSSTLAWDWLMSIDVHWFSTLYGWYVFSGMWLTAMIMAVLVILYLKGKGYLEMVNENHMHDLNKWMFALSFLWSYLWFSQFMLIWYSDIPEEVTYYTMRFGENFHVPFIIMFVINFTFPMIMMMSRHAKRIKALPIFVGSIILIGHWLDTYLLITPGTVGHMNIGFMHVGTFIGFLGLFLYITFNAFTKASFVPKNHPYLDESKHIHV